MRKTWETVHEEPGTRPRRVNSCQKGSWAPNGSKEGCRAGAAPFQPRESTSVSVPVYSCSPRGAAFVDSCLCARRQSQTGASCRDPGKQPPLSTRPGASWFSPMSEPQLTLPPLPAAASPASVLCLSPCSRDLTRYSRGRPPAALPAPSSLLLYVSVSSRDDSSDNVSDYLCWGDTAPSRRDGLRLSSS